MTNEWIEKYKRENWTMPFGSICNAYGQVMAKRTVITLGNFLLDIQEIYELSQSLIAKSLEEKECAKNAPTIRENQIVEPEIQKVKEFLNRIPNKSPAQYEAEAEADNNLNNA